MSSSSAPHEAIAIIGSGCRFPGNADTPSKLWDLLRNPPDLCVPMPASRQGGFNAAGSYHPNNSYHGHHNVKDMKSYFLSGEGVERRFDAGFFGIKPVEANVLDPQVRLLLETTFEALEAAGQTIEGLQGSDTGVYVGLMLGEYEQSMMRDPESIGTYHITGTSRGLMSNRLSYFFDWHGPSMTIDTACSSSLVAVHQAVQLLRSGQSRVAVAAGSNLLLDPNIYVSESKLQMLSPDGQSRMWSADANGYARGEGVATIILKRLRDAVADGDDITCIIRETGTNQDGKTPGLTMPSSTAQEALIRDTYRRARLDPKNPADRPQFFEAHGTGTPAGDPIEAAAIHAAFFGDTPCTDDTTLLVGSIKTVCGHTEGTAGVAGILKAALALQQSIVPPNLLFKSLNPKLKPFAGQLRVPTSALPWPVVEAGQPRRVSVNCFGFGGSNAHAILESYTPPDEYSKSTQGAVFSPFVFSAASEKSLKNYINSMAAHLEAYQDTINLSHLAYTLHTRRSRFPYATAVAASNAAELVGRLKEKLQSQTAEKPVGIRASRDLDHRKPTILGVFTGQGAQWAGMGAELLSTFAVAADVFAKLESRLARLPPQDRPTWSLRQELERTGASSRVTEAELSQPLCTAIQIVLVDVIRAAGLEFGAVVGHSSGEIAAAYTAGLIAADDAICIAYYRGLHGKLAGTENGQKGAMMAVGSSPEDATELIEDDAFKGRVTIGAYNSSLSVTLSGDEDAMLELKDILDDENTFARLLKVEKAYHSHHMLPCAKAYRNSLRDLDISIGQPNGKCTWISSVSGQDIVDHGLRKLKDEYWVENLTSPVQFMQAVQGACSAQSGVVFDLAIEVGPHPALQGPALQTIQETAGQKVPYTGLLRRGASDVVSVADGLGQAWVHLGRGSSLDLQAYERFVLSGPGGNTPPPPPRLVKGLPVYSWDHDTEFWHESRYAKAYFSRTKAHELLGHLNTDCAVDQPRELRWRQILIPKEFPWINGHKLQNQMVFPGAGYVSLAIEASRELLRMSSESATLIEVHDVNIIQALTFDGDDSRVETIFNLTNIIRSGGQTKTISATWQFSGAQFSSVQRKGDSSLRTLAQGSLKLTLGAPSPNALPARGPRPDNVLPVKAADFYESLRQMDYEYSGPFPALSGLQRKLGNVTGYVENIQEPDSELLVHPGMLDAVFQSVLLANSAPYDGSLWSMHVPKTIGSVTVNPYLCEGNVRGKMLPLDSFQIPTINTIKGDMDVYPPEVELAGASHTNAMISVQGLDCVPFSQATAQDDKEVLSVMMWDSALPNAAKAAFDMKTTPEQVELAQFCERLSFFYLQNLQRLIPQDDPSRQVDVPLSKMFDMAKHIESLVTSGQRPFWKTEWNHDTHESIAAASKPYTNFIDFRMLKEIGENLVDIVRGNKTAIEVAMKDNLLNEMYPNALGMAECTVYLARLIKQITHRYPHLNILEIGAGTGGSTKSIMGAVGDSFSSYTYTDISSAFFLSAQDKFKAQSSRMIYKVLDIGKDPFDQGFAEQTYDLIIASMVLHATPVIRQTLQNARKLLKPGGYLVAMEGISNSVARTGTVFGAFPGWWLGADDGRVLGPHVTVAEWDELLRSTGFSGCDTTTPIDDVLYCHTTVLLSQAVDARVNYLRNPLSCASIPTIDAAQAQAGIARAEHLILVGGKTLGSTLMNRLKGILLAQKTSLGNLVHVDSLADVSRLDMSPATTILSLSDVDEPLFQDLTEAKFEAVKKLLQSVGSVLWVTQGRRASNPFANMTVGMVRSVLLEIPTVAFQFLDFEDTGSLGADKIAEALLRFKAGVAWQQEQEKDGAARDLLMTVEREIVLDEHGQMLIPRVVPRRDMNDRYNSSRRPIYKTVALEQENDVSIRRNEERGESWYLEEEEEEEAAELEHRATGDRLHVTHSLLLACRIQRLGYAHLSLARDDCSGTLQVVLSSRVSSAMRALDQVPPVPVLLKDSDSKARFLRLVALNIVAMDTVGDMSPGEHLVVYEPEPAFAALLQREARDQQVGVTIMTSTMSSQRCAFLGWSLVHPQAPARNIQRLLPKGKHASVFLDCEGTAAYIIPHVASPRCKVISIADVFDKEPWVSTARPEVHSRLKTAVMHAQRDGISGTLNVRTIPVNQIAESNAVSDREGREVVVEWDGILEVPVRIRAMDDHKLFSKSKTYWLAGLSGGVGLSLCEWMIGRGAKYIVITSRNPKIAASWLERMAALGAVVKVFPNDMTDMEQTQSLYNDMCTTLPPIGGVAQGAMVLQDTAFRNMTLDDMQKVLRPKVQGSINLDALFYDNTNLEFFVFFSSLVGVLGNAGQSNYSAANLFMASLASQRRQRGLAASVMHIGPILGVGYVSENSDASKAIFSRAAGLQFVSEREMHQHFAEAVVAGRPKTKVTSSQDQPLEIAMGLATVSENPDKKPFWFLNPMAAHFIRSSGTADPASKTSEANGNKASVKSLLAKAKTPDQVTQVLQVAFRHIVCSLFHLGADDLENDEKFLNTGLAEMGLDSLLAVEIRTWWMKTVNVNLSVMKILSGLSVGELIALAVESMSPDLTPLIKGEAEQDLSVPPIISEAGQDLPKIGKAAEITPRINATPTAASSKGSAALPMVKKWTELSFSQQVFWFVLTFLGDRAGLNHTGSFRLNGQLRVGDLERAVLRLGQRHESLRACFKTVDGQPKQGIMLASQLRLERRRISDEREATIVAEELQSYSYDFESGECLRAILLEFSPTTHFLLLGAHSLVLDGLSSVVLTRELLQLYQDDNAALTDSSTICQYPDFAHAQLEAFKAGEFEQGLQFWRREFSACPPPLPVLSISSAISRPVQSRYENQRADVHIDAVTKSRIWDICRQCKVRPFHFFLTAFRALLSRFADVEDIAIGIGDANRSHDGAMGSLGPYINLLPLRFSNDASQRFEAVLQETMDRANAALANSHVPFQIILNDLGVPRSATHTPIFQTFFDYRQGMRKKQPWGDDCELEMLSFQASKVPYDVALDIIDEAGGDGEGCHLMLIVREDMYSKQNAEVLIKSYERLVKAFAGCPDVAFAEPDVFEASEVKRAVGFGMGESLPSRWPEDTVIGRIHAVSQSKPTATAIKLPHGGKSMTYCKMMDKCFAIATALRAQGCVAGSVVAVYQEPTPDWMASTLAVFSIGAVCVPFDAGMPVKRLADIADNSKTCIILVDDDVEEQATRELNMHGTRKIINVEQVIAVNNEEGQMSLPGANDTAMILYTSGSTGVPKGIVLKHGGFRNWAEFFPPLYSTGEPETVLQQSSSSFDMAFLQAFYALCFGGTVCLVPRAMRVDAGAIIDIIANEGVTVTSGVPTEYALWLKHGNQESLARCAHWRTAMFGGEPGANTVVELFESPGMPRPRLFHIYGPTEITFITTGMELFYNGDNKSPAIGRPFPNYSVYVLDEQLRPVPPGIQGEIYVGGAGVASGYLNNTILTAEKFIPDPLAPAAFKAQGWSTMHRTGDMGRWREDGSLVIEGRRSGDTQHKLRGLRIDFQEVENVMLKEAKGVLSQAVVTVRRASPSTQSPEFLVAHVIFDPEHCPPELLSEHEQQQRFLSVLSSSLPLPKYMWPAATIAVQELPMMSSGKLDRRAVAALPLSEVFFLDDGGADVVFTETEERLKKMWESIISKDVTELHRITAETDFFNVGGTSMLLVRLQAVIEQSFEGFRMPLVDMFESSTLGEMARRIDNNTRGSESEWQVLFDWEAETAIPEATMTALKTLAVDHHDPAPLPKVVVLTGATGLVGQGLLQALVADSNITKIHCIGVRNATTRAASLPLLFGHGKVVMHEGDFALPRLGLSEALATQIFSEADRIIHNGADTSHLKTFQSLRGVNLQATKEIVDMCLPRRTPIHYVSTASVLQYSGLPEFGELSAAQYPPPPDAFDGYSASKWASEKFLEKVNEQTRWPIWIHRLTSVQRANTSNGHDDATDNNLDIIQNLLKYCKLANAVPLSDKLSGVMNLVPLERVVESIMREIYVTPTNEVRFLHEIGNVNIALDDIKSFIDSETGVVEVLPPGEWARKAATLGLDAVLVAFFESLDDMRPVVWQRLVKV